jgi:hypothetical protein
MITTTILLYPAFCGSSGVPVLLWRLRPTTHPPVSGDKLAFDSKGSSRPSATGNRCTLLLIVHGRDGNEGSPANSERARRIRLRLLAFENQCARKGTNKLKSNRSKGGFNRLLTTQSPRFTASAARQRLLGRAAGAAFHSPPSHLRSSSHSPQCSLAICANAAGSALADRTAAMAVAASGSEDGTGMGGSV